MVLRVAVTGRRPHHQTYDAARRAAAWPRLHEHTRLSGLVGSISSTAGCQLSPPLNKLILYRCRHYRRSARRQFPRCSLLVRCAAASCGGTDGFHRRRARSAQPRQCSACQICAAGRVSKYHHHQPSAGNSWPSSLRRRTRQFQPFRCICRYDAAF